MLLGLLIVSSAAIVFWPHKWACRHHIFISIMFIMCHAVSGSLIVAANRHRHGRRVVIRLASLGENRILLHEMVLIDIRVGDYSLN
jgi:hypothetical protein